MTNKTLFITGGTSGMAKATVLQAVQAGYNVAFVARRTEEGQAVVDEANNPPYPPVPGRKSNDLLSKSVIRGKVKYYS